jgi:23S rRNA (cytidine1920-2'-O)/16S rRNA (cytidine1409-2'-O)-methyltransferase
MAAAMAAAETERADAALVRRGLFSTRAQAQAAIAAGLVKADGASVTKPAQRLAATCRLEAQPAHPWVSRAGVKLAAALDAFAVDPAGRECLDIGASTGGFTQVLLARGAGRVTAVDVGRGQLHPSLAADPRVRSLEGQDARTLEAGQLPAPPALIVCDASFIGLAKVLARPLSLAAAQAELVALVKPQFDAGPEGVGRGGIARDPEGVAARVRTQIDGLSGFRVLAMIDSPIAGGDGNREFLLHARRGA